MGIEIAKKTKQEPNIISSSMLLSDANKIKETRIKQVSKVYPFRVLRHVKVTCNPS